MRFKILSRSDRSTVVCFRGLSYSVLSQLSVVKFFPSESSDLGFGQSPRFDPLLNQSVQSICSHLIRPNWDADEAHAVKSRVLDRLSSASHCLHSAISPNKAASHCVSDSPNGSRLVEFLAEPVAAKPANHAGSHLYAKPPIEEIGRPGWIPVLSCLSRLQKKYQI